MSISTGAPSAAMGYRYLKTDRISSFREAMLATGYWSEFRELYAGEMLSRGHVIRIGASLSGQWRSPRHSAPWIRRDLKPTGMFWIMPRLIPLPEIFDTPFASRSILVRYEDVPPGSKAALKTTFRISEHGKT